MNQLFGQPGDPIRDGEVDLGPPSANVRPLPVGGAEQAFFHLDVKRSLQLHWRLAVWVASAGVALGIAYFLVQVLVFKSWPSYQAQSLVYVEPTQAKVLEPNGGGAPRWPYDTNTYETYIQQQMMNVTRDDVMADAVRKMNGFKHAGESDQAAAQRLAQSLQVTREGTAYQFAISARARSAAMAADVANAVTDAYIDSASRQERTGDAQRLTMLREEQDRIQKALDADRSEQGTLNRQLGVAAVGTVPDHYDEDITSTRSELIKARTDRDSAEAKFASLDAGRGPSSAAIDAEAEGMIASDAGLVSMKTALNARRATLVTQMANLTPSHPLYKQDEVELEKIDDELNGMVRDLRAKAAARIQLQLKADLERTADVESQVNGQLRQLVGAAGSATPKMQRSNDLAADITRLQNRYASVDEQLHNLILEDNGPAGAYQVTTAQAPLTRTKSGVVRNSLMIAFFGLLIGILAAVGAHKLDPKVYIAKDVELILGFPPMAQLPDFTQVSEGVVEEYLLRLASSIEHARKQSNLRSCVFTGTNEGTGVTTLVNRIGEMLEAMGRPTMLVDATGASAASAHAPVTSPRGAPGLVPVERVSRPTAVLQQMAEETETQEESLVLTDTSPLSVSAETEYLARFVDCAIVVVESGRTTRRELREAAVTLQRLDVAAVGFVLNRVGLAKADPAFRQSVKAIEKHLQVQGARVALRPEKPKTYVAEKSVATPEKGSSETPQKDSARAFFEPELAAAAAAVERFSHPRLVEAAACLPSPTAPVPVAELARRFSMPLTVEAFDSAVAPKAAEPILEKSEPVVHSEVAAVTAPFAAAPVSAPFAEAAKHFSSPLGAEPAHAFASPAASAPFSNVARHFVSPTNADSAAAQPVVAPFAEAAMHFSPPIATSAEPEKTIADEPLTEGSATADAVIAETHAWWMDERLSGAGRSGSVEPGVAEPGVTESGTAEPQLTHVAAETPSEEFPEADLRPFAAISAYEIESSDEGGPIHDIEPARAIEESATEPVAVAAVESEPELVTEAAATVAAETDTLPAIEPIEAAAAVPAQPEVLAQAEPAIQPEAVAQAEPEIASATRPELEPAAVAQPEEVLQPAAQAIEDVPWWLSQANRNPGSARPPLLWRPARVRVAQPMDFAPEPLPVGPEPQQASSEQAQQNPWVVTTQNWGRLPATYDLLEVPTVPAETGTSEMPKGEQEDIPTPLTSRLSGLRNLLFVMGVKNPQGTGEEPEWAAAVPNPNFEKGSSAEPKTEKRSSSRTNPEDVEAMAVRGIVGAAPRLVTAPPEFLPPKPSVVSVGKDGAPTGESSTRQDRRASYDGVEILPSRRGQYKKI